MIRRVAPRSSMLRASGDRWLFGYADIVTLSLSDEAALEAKMGLAPGTIAEERWRDQAEMLRKGKFDEHARMFA